MVYPLYIINKYFLSKKLPDYGHVFTKVYIRHKKLKFSAETAENIDTEKERIMNMKTECERKSVKYILRGARKRRYRAQKAVHELVCTAGIQKALYAVR